MKENESMHYNYLSVLNNIKSTEINDTLLELFCTYISSNDSFKYNKTYLTDQLIDFKNAVLNFSEKKQCAELFVNKLSQEFSSLNNWFIIIENVFFVNKDIKLSLLSSKVKDLQQVDSDNRIASLLNERFYLSAQLKKFNFFQQCNINEKKIKFHFINFEEENEYFFIYDLYKKSEKKEIYEKKINDEIEISILLKNAFLPKK